MSYDIRLTDAATGETIQFDEAHQLVGGMYAIGGTTEAWLNVTYNYSPHYYREIDAEKGIRAIYGMTAAASLPLLAKAIAALGTDVHDDYWEPTEGNARAALVNLFNLATMAPPDAVWDGD